MNITAALRPLRGRSSHAKPTPHFGGVDVNKETIGDGYAAGGRSMRDAGRTVRGTRRDVGETSPDGFQLDDEIDGDSDLNYQADGPSR